DRVLHERSREELAVLAVDDPLQQGLAKSLSEAADDLSVDEQRVDGVAAVVDGDEALEANLTRVLGHADDGQARAEAPGRLILAKEHGRLEAGRLVGWQAHSAIGELADSVPADDLLRQALHLKAAAHELKVFRARLQKARGQPPSLVPDFARGPGQRVSAEACAAAAERSDRLRRAERVAVADDHVLPGDAELVGDDLGEGGLVPLSVRTRSSDRRDLAAALDPDDSALPAEHIRGFHVGRDADPHDLAAAARRRLLAAELSIAGEVDDAIEGACVVAGVVGGTERRAVGK